MQAIIRTGGGNPITSCNDDPLSTAPTCGWATDASGNNVYASQGFCCSCTSSALAAATLTSGTNQRDILGHSGAQSCPKKDADAPDAACTVSAAFLRQCRKAVKGRAASQQGFVSAETRANLNCDLLNSWFHLPGSASCLRMDPLNYQVRGSLFTIPGIAVRAEGTPPHVCHPSTSIFDTSIFAAL